MQAHTTRSSLVRFAKSGMTLVSSHCEGATHVDMSANIRRAAFILAEVLITLGIIGIVAAMTIPTLISKYKEVQTVSKLKKCYSTLANAFKMTQDESVNTETTFNMIKPYLKIAKDCGFEPGCFTAGNSKTLDGRTYADYDNLTSDEYRFILSDGTSAIIYLPIGDEMGDKTVYGNIKVDIDGKDSGEYTFGKDIFVFNITNKGIVPTGMRDAVSADFEAYCDRDGGVSNGNGQACTAWVIYNENMDYLHCDDLSWDGKHSCDE